MLHKNLWAPWRMAYIQQLSQNDSDPVQDDGSCFLCVASEAQNEAQKHEAGVLINDPRGMLLLNRYPYTNGHLLVSPHAHVGDLSDLSQPQHNDLMALTFLGQQLLKKAIGPQGFNIGMNLGRCAGAGCPGHLHMHIVPRWSGDTNFMMTVGGIRVQPDSLEASYQHLLATLKQM